MTESFLIFTPNPPSISTMTSFGKLSQWRKLSNDLQNILGNYKKNGLNHQEMRFFNFLDQTFDQMTPSYLQKTIKKFMDKIKDETKDEMKENRIKITQNFFSNDKTIFNVNFRNIFPLVYIIMYILENISTKGKTSDVINDFINNDKIPEIKEKKDQKVIQIIKLFNNVKTLNICLYTEESNVSFKEKEKQAKINNVICMKPKIVFFFGLFYKALFKKN